MRNKSLFLLVACVCGTIAAIGVSQWMHAQGKGGGQTDEILVAAVDIDKGEEITAEKVLLEQWPSGKAPMGSSSDIDSVLGKFAKTRFYAGEALMDVKLTESSHKVIPKGYNVVALKARDVSIANVIQPGDLVNVMAYFNKSELIPRSITKTVLMGVRVYALDGDTERKVGEDRAKNVNDIQLLIHMNDAEAWTYANELGKIRLAVGNDDDYGADTAEDGSSIAGKEFVDWMEDYQREQEERAREAERKKLEAAQGRGFSNPGTIQVRKRSKNAFEITKLVEGRMIKYLIEPGKLPVIIEDTGPIGQPDSSGDLAPNENGIAEPDQQEPEADDDRDEDYSYLNGEDSPFYQPPTTQRSGADY